MLTLPLRNILRHRVRTGLTLAAIVFGVVGLIISGGFVEDIFIQLRESTIHSQLGHVQVYRTAYRTVGRRDPYQYLIEDSETLVNELTTLPHVLDVMKRLSFSGLANNGHADLAIFGEGVEPEKESQLGTAIRLVAGRNLTDADTYGVVIGKGVAASLRLEPGDYLTILTNTPDGALNSLEFTVVGVFQTFSKDYDNRAVRIPLLSAQELLAIQAVHNLVLSLDDTAATDRVIGWMRKQLDAKFDVVAWYELSEFYNKTVELYRRQLGALQLIISVLVLLSVTSSVNMSIFERVGEFGTLQSLGTRKRDVFRLVLTENVLLGSIGAGFGLLFGVLLAYLLSSMGIPMPPLPNSDVGYAVVIRIVPSTLVTASLIGMIATILAAVLPAMRVIRIPVADALRRSV